jgi:hypothetical protein
MPTDGSAVGVPHSQWIPDGCQIPIEVMDALHEICARSCSQTAGAALPYARFSCDLPVENLEPPAQTILEKITTLIEAQIGAWGSGRAALQ